MRELLPPNFFVGFPVGLPFSVRSWLKAISQEAPEFLKMFAESDLHITLAFLGPLEPQQVIRVLEEVSRIQMVPFQARFGCMCMLPSPGRCSALSLKFLEGREKLEEFMQNWGKKIVEAVGKEPDSRPPLPHMTLARPRRWTAEIKEKTILWMNELVMPQELVDIGSPVLFTRSEDRRRRLFMRIDHAEKHR